MKVVKRTATPTFTPITLDITIESELELSSLLQNLEHISKGRYNTSPLFDVMCFHLLDALNK